MYTYFAVYRLKEMLFVGIFNHSPKFCFTAGETERDY